MEARLIEALTDCLECMASGESLENCLRRHPAERAELEPLLRASAMLRHLPGPPPIDLAKVEQAALARAAELRAAATVPNSESASATRKLPGWVLPACLAAFLIVLIIMACTVAVVIAVIVRWPQPVITPAATPALSFTPTPILPHTLTVAPTATCTPAPTRTRGPTAVTATPLATSPVFPLPLPPPSGGDDDEDHGDSDDGGGDEDDDGDGDG